MSRDASFLSMTPLPSRGNVADDARGTLTLAPERTPFDRVDAA